VWQTLSEGCEDDKCWTYVKPFQQQGDGREAFQALHAHYLGANHVNNMASVAGAKLTQAKYHQEKRGYNFKFCIPSLTKQFRSLTLCAGMDTPVSTNQARSGAQTLASKQRS
jgi:hypothetical protein